MGRIIPYMKWKIITVWNHQPDYITLPWTKLDFKLGITTHSCCVAASASVVPLPCVQRYLESQGSKRVATNTSIVWRMGHRCWWRYADDSNWEIRQAPINKPKHLMYRTVAIPFLISLKLLRPELRHSLGCSRKGPTWQQSPIRDGKYWSHPHVGKTMP